MSGFYDYILIDEDGKATITEEEPDSSWDCYPTVIRFCLIDYGQDVQHEKLTVDGWVELKECE